jgi:hypothetical protein
MLADGTIGLPAALGGVLLVTSALQLVAIVAGRYASDQERRPARLASRGLDSAAS